MKKILIPVIALIVTFTVSGCLKDKGYDNKQYGLDGIGEVGAKGVGIPEASSTIVFRAYEVIPTPFTADFLFINLNSAQPATEDVHVNLVMNNTLISDYNTANAANLVPLTPGAYSFPTMKVTIPKGSNSAYLKINFPNTTGISPTANYAVGLSISSVDEAGYTIAANQKNMLVQINIKNKFDGIYKLTGNHNRPTLDGRYVGINVQLITSGQFSAYMFWPNSSANFIYQGNSVQFGGPNVASHPIATSAGGLSYYGSFTVNYIFNAMDQMVGWNQSPYPFTVTNQMYGTYSRYVPATKSIYANFGYNGNPARQFFDTLEYVAPRP